MDILCSSYWLENDGLQNYMPRSISPEILYSTIAADLDGDGDMDLIAATNEHGIVYIENEDDSFFDLHIVGKAFEFYAEIFRVQAADWDNDGDADIIFNTSCCIFWYENLGTTDISNKPSTKLPEEFGLDQNCPNPFNPVTTINYQLPINSEVDLSVYNILGQKVATLVSKKQPAGQYEVQWDANGFASGVYLYRLETDNGFIETKKLVLLK
jgi:hypothetical protein